MKIVGKFSWWCVFITDLSTHSIWQKSRFVILVTRRNTRVESVVVSTTVVGHAVIFLFSLLGIWYTNTWIPPQKNRPLPIGHNLILLISINNSSLKSAAPPSRTWTIGNRSDTNKRSILPRTRCQWFNNYAIEIKSWIHFFLIWLRPPPPYWSWSNVAD